MTPTIESAPPSTFLNSFAGSRYVAQARLVMWFPRGVLDDQLVDRIVEFIEYEEATVRRRFTDTRISMA